MANKQTTIPFCVRKTPNANFYSCKSEDDTSHVISNKNLEKKEAPVYVPRVKKIFELNSSDENIDISIVRTPQKNLKRKYIKKSKKELDGLDIDCSPPKVSRGKNASANQLPKDVDNEKINIQNKIKSLPGREMELEKLTEFLNNHLESQTSSSLYISGPPGTGKTACLMNILERQEFKDGFTEVYINCTTMMSAGSIYNRICQELHIKSVSSTEKASLTAIDKYLAKKHKMILLVLDEIDQLTNKKQSVLYTIFEWPMRIQSKILLIGIANALDLTDRVLPRLHARPDLKLDLMHFPPYTKQQIITIFKKKMEEEMNNDLFSPAAIQMLAGKVAAISGDIRRAIDIGKRVVDLATHKTDNNMKKSTVELKEVMSVLNDVYGASQNLESDMDDSFPLQQKILICSLLLLLTKGKNKNVTLGKLHDVYKRVCCKRNILAVDSTEFVSLCNLVETRGIIKLNGKKEPRTHKVVLQWDESEVTKAIRDKKMISDILSDTNCIS